MTMDVFKGGGDFDRVEDDMLQVEKVEVSDEEWQDEIRESFVESGLFPGLNNTQGRLCFGHVVRTKIAANLSRGPSQNGRKLFCSLDKDRQHWAQLTMHVWLFTHKYCKQASIVRLFVHGVITKPATWRLNISWHGPFIMQGSSPRLPRGWSALTLTSTPASTWAPS